MIANHILNPKNHKPFVKPSDSDSVFADVFRETNSYLMFVLDLYFEQCLC